MIKLRIFVVLFFVAVLSGAWIELDPYPVLAAAFTPAEECYAFLPEGKATLLRDMPFQVSSEELLASAFSAISTWHPYTGEVFGNGEVNTSTSYVYGDGINTITFGVLEEGTAAGTSYRVASFLDGSKLIIEWDIILNAELAWGDSYKNNQLADFQVILTHELGHVLGLGHPSGLCLQNVMYDTPWPFERYLGEGDITGIEVLYP